MRYGADSYLTGRNRYSSNLAALNSQDDPNNGSQMGGLSNILSNGMQGYQMSQMFGNGGSGSGLLSGLLGGGTNASGGASGLAFQGGAPASSGSGGFLSNLFGGGGGAGAGAMSAMGPLALFGAGMYLALSESGKHDKQLKKLRAELGPEEIARRNAKARADAVARDKREGDARAAYSRLHVNDGD